MVASGDAMPQRLRLLPGLVQAPGHLLVIAAYASFLGILSGALGVPGATGPQVATSHVGDSYLRLSLAAVHLVQKPGPFPPR